MTEQSRAAFEAWMLTQGGNISQDNYESFKEAWKARGEYEASKGANEASKPISSNKICQWLEANTRAYSVAELSVQEKNLVKDVLMAIAAINAQPTEPAQREYQIMPTLSVGEDGFVKVQYHDEPAQQDVLDLFRDAIAANDCRIIDSAAACLTALQNAGYKIIKESTNER